MSVTDVIYVVIQLIFLEGILSIDNAAVLGALVSVLPTDKVVPWPGPLRFLEKPVDRLLGKQQMAALKVGLLGAYLGRGLMLLMASFVIHNPWLRLLGAAYLIKLALQELGIAEEGEEEQFAERATDKTFWLVVLNVELADLAFSIDNVVAAVALSDKLWVVLLGVAFGIVTMRFAAGIFTWMIKFEPLLKEAAYMVVFNIGVELILSDLYHIHFEHWQKFAISIGTLILFVAYARLKFLHFLAPVWRWIGQGMGNLNELIDWALKPAIEVIKLIFRALGWILKPVFAMLPHHEPAGTPAYSSNPGPKDK